MLPSLRNRVSAVLTWNLALDPTGGPNHGGCQTCSGIVTIGPDGTIERNAEYAILGQLSRYVPPGSGAGRLERRRTERGVPRAAGPDRRRRVESGGGFAAVHDRRREHDRACRPRGSVADHRHDVTRSTRGAGLDQPVRRAPRGQQVDPDPGSVRQRRNEPGVGDARGSAAVRRDG